MRSKAQVPGRRRLLQGLGALGLGLPFLRSLPSAEAETAPKRFILFFSPNFWIDRAHGGRKVLAAVRQASVERNDWFDGPFDQLADNYADQTNIRHYIEEALPDCRGRIDKWGYFTDEGDRPNRVALNNYGTWVTTADAVKFFGRALKSGDVRQFISRGRTDGTGEGSGSAPKPAPNVRK